VTVNAPVQLVLSVRERVMPATSRTRTDLRAAKWWPEILTGST
jgi:hypothetical protein